VIVYREESQQANAARLVAKLRAQVASFRKCETVGHEAIRDFVIEMGIAEAAIVDALCPAADSDDSLQQQWRHAALIGGTLFCESWAQRPSVLRVSVSRHHFCELEPLLENLQRLAPPGPVSIRKPEGYAYYGLYPEMYVESARKFARAAGRGSAVCIGIRSIGTSLSAMAAAALLQLGWTVHSFTVRPRGHPFERRLEITRDLARVISLLRQWSFLIIDEGPGLSGSSMTCVAEQLSELGVEESHISFFPAWIPDANRFVSKQPQSRWRRHEKYCTSFEQVWMEQRCDLVSGICSNELVDASAGKWRTLMYSRPSQFPAVQPEHERRKYFWRPKCDAESKKGSSISELTDSQPLLLKFCGLGQLGRSKAERAERLCAAGFAPNVKRSENGFLLTPIVAGNPAQQSESEGELFHTISRYCTFVKHTFPSSRPIPFDDLMEMMTFNIGEGLSCEWKRGIAKLDGMKTKITNRETVAIDGRMMPHEWIATVNGYIKVDGLDHHDDHFFPGCQDIAWDLAGASVEFGMDPYSERLLCEAYAQMSGDRRIAHVLPFYTVAYSAYRLGYATLSEQTLRPDPDAERFALLIQKYKNRLLRELSLLC
jgi:hypothetical protein